MEVQKAAEKMLDRIERKFWPKEKQVGNAPDQYDHIEWMLEGIEKGYILDEKAHRWLGWAQAVIHIHQGIDLDTLKHINKTS